MGFFLFVVYEVPFIVLCSTVVIFLIWGQWVIHYLIVKAVTDSSEDRVKELPNYL